MAMSVNTTNKTQPMAIIRYSRRIFSCDGEVNTFMVRNIHVSKVCVKELGLRNQGMNLDKYGHVIFTDWL